MKIVAEISEATLGLGESEKLNTSYELRKSARAILRNAEGKIAIQHLQNYNYRKLPGGGVDPGESIDAALLREIREEVGCDAEINDLIGMIIEYRNKYNLLHISYCFSASVMGEVGEPALEEGEIEEGQITIWITPEEALEQMSKDVPEKYEGYFILEREMAFLTEYLKNK